MTLEQVRCSRRADRDEDPAADPLDDPARDQLVEGLAATCHERADDEQDERPEEQPARAPDIREATGQRHRHDVGEQVTVHDPRGVAELREGRLPELVGDGEVEQDAGQGRRRDHQLEAREEHPDPEDGEEAPGVEPAHPCSVQGAPGSRPTAGVDMSHRTSLGSTPVDINRR